LFSVSQTVSFEGVERPDILRTVSFQLLLHCKTLSSLIKLIANKYIIGEEKESKIQKEKPPPTSFNKQFINDTCRTHSS
jgi:hypothetical protein